MSAWFQILVATALAFVPLAKSSAISPQPPIQSIDPNQRRAVEQLTQLCYNKGRLHPACQRQPRLRPFGKNYVIFQWTDDDKDELATEAHFSFQIMLTRRDCVTGKSPSHAVECLQQYSFRREVFASYTGEFDFYAKTRPSNPVTNRISSPGIHLRQHLGLGQRSNWLKLNWFEVSLEHRSNGQVLNVGSVRVESKKLLQNAYKKNDYSVFDGVSRSANYVEMTSKSSLFLIQPSYAYQEGYCDLYFSCIGLSLSYKFYVYQEADISWGPLAGSDTSFRDYDLVRVLLENKWGLEQKRRSMSLEVVGGSGKLDTLSYNADIGFTAGPLPVLIRAHHGPMGTLSNYTNSITTLGIGLALDL